MGKESTAPILMVDAPERNADLRHLSGFWAPDPVVFLKSARGRLLFVSALEQGRAQQLAADRPELQLTVLTPDLMRLKGRRRRQLEAWMLALLRRESVWRVLVPKSFPVALARALERRGVQVRVAAGSLCPEREVKTPAELASIRECQRAAVAGLHAGIRVLRAARIDAAGRLRQGRRGLDVADVKLAIQTELLRHGTFCRDLIVAPGAQGADPHERGHGPLRAGEPIVMDIFPQHLQHGYWGDLTRTVVRGRATPAVRRLYAAVKAAQRAALAGVRPGAPCRKIHAAVLAMFARRGFKTELVGGRPEGFIHSTGHGLGLEIHEAPWLAPTDGRLRRGQVITVEPGLYYAAHGGLRIEDSVEVVAGGWAPLARAPDVFEI